METIQHQEWRSRQRVNWRAVSTTALFVGGLTFVMSGGSPWSTAGTMNAIVGRDYPWNFVVLILGHFMSSYLYAAIIALAIYRFRIIAAMMLSLGVSLALCWVTGAIYESFGWVMQSPATRALLTHMAFGLYAAAVYKGACVPPRQMDERN
jgi:hypothetical protein